jgi:hypothetical protein
MATLAVVVWLITGYLFISEWMALVTVLAKMREMPFLPKYTFFSLLFVHGIMVIPVSYGIYWDLYSKIPSLEIGNTSDIIKFALISGFLALGAFSVSSFWIHRIASPSSSLETKKHAQNASPRKKIIVLVIEVIGLVASILGIISFYLDYLR